METQLNSEGLVKSEAQGILTMMFRDFLASELDRMKTKNKRFSLRSFALFLRVDSSLLSKIMKGKRKPSRRLIESICQILHVTPPMQAHFLKETDRPARRFPDSSYQVGEELQGEIVWQLPILFETLRVAPTADLSKLGSLLQIESMDSVLSKIESLGMMKKGPQGFQTSYQHIQAYSTAVTCENRRSVQKKYLDMATQALEQVDMKSRVNTTVTVAVNQTQLSEIKELVYRFQRALMKISEKHSAQADQVYNMTLAFYPTMAIPKVQGLDFIQDDEQK
jgi:transcriptional regulator with XRE-family HTH domain